MNKTPNILVIRLGLLGDMACTTPMLEAIKRHFPDGRLCLLSNEYNRPIVARNPYIDKLYIYVHTKGRERNPRPKLFASLIDAWRLKRDLKRERFDWIVVCNGGFNKPSVRIAQKLGGKIISATRGDGSYEYRVDFPISGLLAEPIQHEAERTFRLLEPIGIFHQELPRHLTLSPDPLSLQEAKSNLLPKRDQTRIAIHISARDPRREWPISKFAKTIHDVHVTHPTAVFWVIHAPNDQQRVDALSKQIAGVPVRFISPSNTESLIATLALSTLVICQEGGILHLAAGLNKKVVGLFENTPEKIGAWYPWGVEHALVKSLPGEPIAEITSQAVTAGILRLLGA